MHIANCGLDCSGCKVYQATAMPLGAERNAAQEAIASEWQEKFHYDFKAEHMVCEGCQSEMLCGYCKSCEIRTCAKEKSIEFCNTCDEFPCEKVTTFQTNTKAANPTMTFVF